MKEKITKIIKFAICAILSNFFFACSNFTDSEKGTEFAQEYTEPDTDSTEASKHSTKIEEDSTASFIHLVSDKKNTVLGTNDASARIEDRPAMNVSLKYDFYLGKHEVTQGEFCNLMKCKVHSDSVDFPKINVTLYDAILYANALSKQEKFDTVYTYSQAKFDNEGKCIFLQDIVTHYNSDGFRLPTEAEWVYAASLNWNTKKSWNADNSNYTIHKVCTVPQQDSTIFCDMEGNVMEWVNDWVGKYFGKTVTNYAGAPTANSKGERTLKGGSFNMVPEEITLFSRSDTYTVTSISSADYVGFRLARGAIPDVIFLNDAGSSENVVINSLATTSDIYAAIGTKNAKLVFRNDVTGNLAFIYYRNGNNAVEIIDTIDSYHPDISPDGKYVAFCTKAEGSSEISELYVRKLDAEGSGLQKLNVESAAIPRFRVLPNNDTVIVYVSNAGNNQINSTWKSYSTWQVPFHAGKFGTPQKLYDGSYHGGISESGNLAVSGARILRARIKDGRDTIWYNGEQACNVSLSTDGTSRTLFLDFGGKTGRAFVGNSYQMHQQILVTDSNGILLQSIKSPLGYTFDHTEWVRGQNMSVATLSNANGAHEKIVLVNMESSTLFDLVESEELYHPCFWAETSLPKTPSSSSDNSQPTSSEQTHSSTELSSSSEARSSSENTNPELFIDFDMDSAGVYSNTGSDYHDFIMRYKMELLWKYKNESDVVIIGSSRPLDGVIPKNFNSKFNVVNLAQTPNSIFGSRDFFKNYIFPHYKKMKYLIVSLDIDFWWKSDTQDNVFYNIMKNYAGYIYDKNHNYWKGYNTDNLLLAAHNSQGSSTVDYYIEEKGLSIGECATLLPTISSRDSTVFDNKPHLLVNSTNALKDIIELAAKRGITVIGVIFPMNSRFKNTGAYGYYGLRRSTSGELVEDLKGIADSYSNFVFLDENKFGDHDYTDDMFQDNQHLCGEGAKQITGRLDSLLLTLEP